MPLGSATTFLDYHHETVYLFYNLFLGEMEPKQSSTAKIHHVESCAVANPSQTLKLWNATTAGCLACVNAALTSGADVNMTEKYTGRTPLMEAVKKDYTDCIDKLLEMGADVNRVDCKKKRPFFSPLRDKKTT